MASTNRKSILAFLQRLAKEQTGATAVEYGIMIAAIAAVIITVVFAIGFKLENAFTFVDTEMDGVTQP